VADGDLELWVQCPFGIEGLFEGVVPDGPELGESGAGMDELGVEVEGEVGLELEVAA
jgi:hypothetical protein